MFTECTPMSGISPEEEFSEAPTRLKRSPYFYPYRVDDTHYFLDDSDVDANDSFDRKRRIAYYYPQRAYNFVSFDDEDDEDRRKKKRGLYYYPQASHGTPIYNIDDEVPDEMDRRRRQYMPLEEDSANENSNEVFTRRRRVVPYYFPRFGSNPYKGFYKRFSYYDNDYQKKKKRSTEDEAEVDDARRKKRQNKRSEIKRSLLLDDLANDDLSSFGYDKREVRADDQKRAI